MIVRYLTHPQVEIDPMVAVQHWRLNEVGRRRVAALSASGALAGTRAVVSSAETKAIETALPIASSLGAEHRVCEGMHENDRSATGFLPPAEFKLVADQLFATPERSVRGWERAADAQTRIVRETMDALEKAPPGDLLLVGHGAVGTLLMCHLAGWPIDRSRDQPGGGGGNFFAFERNTLRLLSNWTAMEDMAPADEARPT